MNVKVNVEVDPRARALQEVEVKVRGPRLTSPCSGKTSGCFLYAAPTGSGHNPADVLPPLVKMVRMIIQRNQQVVDRHVFAHAPEVLLAGAYCISVGNDPAH